ncbi:A/G-specific adenine glycosylase [Flavobacterium branchiophilum NBRC 15030 = ATCC 35035]|uniref:Adenine DNA glycosylase n=1 Tax=Flavobacterium branchiophilum TaxID=55197 RepID=A0A543G2X3_9FLAO|nr:A/G-specific adenine glycosylase [Flavobacterium branchiophilum]OXA80891.1 A/G-specific adenine glycosylase [Flavobacterium branchiophilum NBRC 15030 = ATCC 35035]TQM40428.1 A/G-specific DNA-adenine glycosylase [Flavobacterium branchiophilum]
MSFSSKLIQWYHLQKRDLPWRNTTNPYPIWLSEIMLQQTRVAQGLPYYEAFMNHFPTIFHLANASEEQVLKLWQGLGYYSRARNLHQTAQTIAFEKNGIFPDNYKDLLKLKGIGSYTAAAIASFSYNECVPVVDGNVFRVLARYFDISNDIALIQTKSVFSNLALELMPKEHPALFNQAIMEFGALQCVPKNPDCNSCIFSDSCLALQKKKVAQLPVKIKKIKVKNRFLNYFILQDEKANSIVQKRIAKDIWQNLYEFPLLESLHFDDDTIVLQYLNDHYNVKSLKKLQNEPIIHKLTHQKLHLQFWKVQIEGQLNEGKTFDAIKSYPFPIVIHHFLETFSNFEEM